MRKFVKLILAIFIILNILLSSNSYAICNTVRADNRVTAVRLTLQNGQILHEFTVDEKDVVSPDGTLDNVQIQNAKKLELIFIVDTDTSDLNAEKSCSPTKYFAASFIFSTSNFIFILYSRFLYIALPVSEVLIIYL